MLFIITAAVLLAKPSEQGLFYDQSVGAQMNPLGLAVDSRILYRIPLGKPGNILFESTKIDVGFQNLFTPADDLMALYCTIEPIAVFDVTARVGFLELFKLLGFGFIRLSGPTARYDGDATSGITQEHHAGLWASIAPRVKIQVWNFILAHTLTVNYFDMFITNYYFERHTDSVHRGTDFDINNDSYLFYKISDLLMVGANNFCLNVPSTGYVSDRVSAMLVFTPTLPCFYDLYAVIMAGSFVVDHYYVGKLYLAAMVGFTIKMF
ncbi:MAG: hypothetical protein AABZ39_06935 [Spirochaetota bacterium]